MSTVLFVVTGARSWTLADGSSHPTGYWAEEVLTPWRALVEAGHDVAFATPGGVVPVPDEGSLADDDDLKAVLAGLPKLSRPLRLEDIHPAHYDAIFYPGGHGPMQDLAINPSSGALLVAALDEEKPVGLVCHGLAALLAAKRPDGTNAAAGRTVTAFSDEEERQANLADKAPWLLETTLRKQGITVDVAEAWTDHVVKDGNLVTGQNPQSSASVVQALITRMAA